MRLAPWPIGSIRAPSTTDARARHPEARMATCRVGRAGAKTGRISYESGAQAVGPLVAQGGAMSQVIRALAFGLIASLTLTSTQAFATQKLGTVPKAARM